MNWGRFFKLTWTACSLTVAVLLCVLWVRSYWHPDSMTSVDSNLVLSRLGSNCGVFFFGAADYKTTPTITPPEATGGWEYQAYDPPIPSTQAWRFESTTDHWGVCVPAWFATSLVVAAATAPWLQCSKRFSLRTAFIAVTVVAVVLGFVVWAVK